MRLANCAGNEKIEKVGEERDERRKALISKVSVAEWKKLE